MASPPNPELGKACADLDESHRQFDMLFNPGCANTMVSTMGKTATEWTVSNLKAALEDIEGKIGVTPSFVRSEYLALQQMEISNELAIRQEGIM